LGILDGAGLLSVTPEELNSILHGDVYALHRVAALSLSRALHPPGSAFVLYLSLFALCRSFPCVSFSLGLLSCSPGSPCVCAHQHRGHAA
jgi:hypothetical protein